MVDIESDVLLQDQEESIEALFNTANALGFRIVPEDPQVPNNQRKALAIFKDVRGVKDVEITKKSSDWGSLRPVARGLKPYNLLKKQLAKKRAWNEDQQKAMRKAIRRYEDVVRDEIWEVGNGKQERVPEQEEKNAKTPDQKQREVGSGPSNPVPRIQESPKHTISTRSTSPSVPREVVNNSVKSKAQRPNHSVSVRKDSVPRK